MEAITPRQYLPIVMQISDPLDTNTYYVRAFIYKFQGSETRELVDTVDLVDRGNQRFTYQYQTPADPTGEGYFLSIIIKTYTDSGYTSESPNYERNEERYFVKEDTRHFGGGGGATEVNIDYGKIRKLIEKEISKEKKEVSMKSVIQRLEEVKLQIKDFNNKYSQVTKLEEKLDTIAKSVANKENKKVLSEIQKIRTKIEEIKIPEPQKADLSPVLSKLSEIEISSKRGFRNILQRFDRFKNQFIAENKDTFMGRLLKLEDFTKSNSNKRINI